MDPTHQQFFLCSFCAASEAITNGLSASRAASANTHWAIWSAFCTRVALDPLILLYKEPIPILVKFAAKYRRGDISYNIQ